MKKTMRKMFMLFTASVLLTLTLIHVSQSVSTNQIELTRHDVFALIEGYFKNYDALDWRYRTMTTTEVKKLIEEFLKERRLYKEDFYDCDDFAFEFKVFASKRGLTAVGIVNNANKEAAHMFNVIITAEKKLMLFDATTGLFEEFGTQKEKKYELGPGAYLII
ncbi:MAG: hypothetical protein QW540_07705 [Archaeoglobaceae archaeon]